jgi:hypothetical protein
MPTRHVRFGPIKAFILNLFPSNSIYTFCTKAKAVARSTINMPVAMAKSFASLNRICSPFSNQIKQF